MERLRDFVIEAGFVASLVLAGSVYMLIPLACMVIGCLTLKEKDEA